MNLFQRFEQTASTQPDRVALQIKEGGGYRRLTYGEAARQVRALAGGLVRAGLSPGDRVALLSENRPEWAVAYFAIGAAGGVAVPLDVQLSDAELANVLGHAGCRLAVCSSRQGARPGAIRAAGHALERIVDLDAAASAGSVLALAELLREATAGAATPLPAVDREALASLLYTSGTTGQPKGVMLTHGNFLANAESVIAFRLVSGSDTLLSVLPLHHAFSFTVQLIHLFVGATITFPPSLKGPDLLACMRETGVTVLVGVPQLFYHLHRGIFEQIERRPLPVRLLLGWLLRLSGALRPAGVNLGRLVFGTVHRRFGGAVRILASGGARLDPAIARDFLALGFTLTEGYGLTETAPVVAFNPLDRIRPGTVGVPLPGVEVAIREPDGEGVGEIIIRGPNVMRGYYDNPRATAQVLDADGWFRTGDLGYLDGHGHLVITGRAKEVIVLSSGKNIYPEEVEEQYLASRYIKEICLIPQAAVRRGATEEGLLALVLPDLDGFRATGMTNIFETVRWDMENVGKGLAAWKRPTGLVIVQEAFPRTRLGKVQRHLVPERYRDEIAGAGRRPTRAAAEAPEDAVARRVLAHLGEVTGRPAVRLDDSLELDLGMDSLARVEMLVALEKMLGCKIPDEAAAECFTVGEVVECLKGLQGAPRPGPGPAPSRAGWAEILATEPPPEVLAMLEAGRRPAARLVTRLSRGICLAVFRSLYRLRVEGREQLPASGPLILASNHCSYFDAFILAAALPGRVVQQSYYMGFEGFFRHPALAWWARQVRVIPVDVDSYLVRAMQTSARILRDGKVLCLFPEGERSVTGRLRPFRKGTGILLKELGVPVLPVYISGSYEAWPRGQRLPGIHPIRVRFGPIVTAETLLAGERPAGADEAEGAVLRLQERVAALRP